MHISKKRGIKVYPLLIIAFIVLKDDFLMDNLVHWV